MAAKSNRPQLAPRTFRLVDEEVRARILAAVKHLPIDELRPLEVVVREEQKRRRPDANAAMWAGPLRDIAEQAWLDGRQFSAEVWHIFLKRQLLPEDYDPQLCLEGYCKWDIDPAGERVLVGSTTQLTVKGMGEYLEALHAFGASLGVEYSVRLA